MFVNLTAWQLCGEMSNFPMPEAKNRLHSLPRPFNETLVKASSSQ